MLKHVHASTSSLSPYRLKSPARDTVSLTSSISFGSSGGQEPLSSRSSSSSSLHDSALRPHKDIFIKQLLASLEDEPSSSSRDLAAELGVDQKTSSNHLNQLDFVHKTPRQDPHELTGAQAKKLVEICLRLLNNPLNDQLWKHIVTSDKYLTTVKVYSKVICSDMEYKTLSITQQTTSKDVVCILLNKFKMKHRDPNLFYLTMEVWMRKKGVPIRSVMVLEDEAHPAELQACHPRGESKFSLKMRRGGLVKVFGGSCLMAGSLYKSLLVSDRTSVDELIQLVLHCYNSTEHSSKFALYEVCTTKNYERKLHPSDLPLQIQQEWPSSEHFAFHLRRNIEAFQRRGWLGSSTSLCFRLYV